MKRMPPRVDLRGHVFGFLVVKEWRRDLGAAHGKWLCVCECGREKLVRAYLLRSNQTRSCGCQSRQMQRDAVCSHGLSKTAIYRVWRSMRDRCEREKSNGFKNYGGRGIKVCERWMSFENFLMDMGARPDGLTIERKDVNGDYEPGNCVWATRKQQSRNTRSNINVTHNGKTQCLADWAEEIGVPIKRLRRRMSVEGMTFQEAIAKPSRYSASATESRR